jgi:predicted Na+-dependent transporter
MGFVFYLAGTFIPFILNIILNGMESVTIDTKTMVISVLGTLLFPILYATQLKELTN